MGTQLQKRPKYIAFLLSLLIHIIFLIIIAAYRGNTISDAIKQLANTVEHEEVQKKEEEQKQEWVETKTGTSSRIAPVIFYDAPGDGEDTDQCDTNSTIDTQNQDNVPNTDDVTVSTSEITPLTTQCIVAHEQNNNESEGASRETAVTVVQPIKSDFVRQDGNAQEKRVAASAARMRIRREPLQQQKKQAPTLAQLTHGFLKNICDEGGTCTVKMLGTRKGTPADDQMKYEMYLQKLNKCLETSFTINKKQLETHLPIDVTADVYIALNQDGSLKKMEMMQSSGYINIDQFIRLAMHDASSSFPPVPHYLPHNPFEIIFRIIIGGAQRFR